MVCSASKHQTVFCQANQRISTCTTSQRTAYQHTSCLHLADRSSRLTSQLQVMQEHLKKQILIRAGTHYRGYQQLGANVTRYEAGFQRDWHEAIDLYREQNPQVSAYLKLRIGMG